MKGVTHARLGPRPTHVRYVVMTFLCALSFLTYFDRVCIMRAQNDIMSGLHLTKDQMGIIFSAFWFAYALFEIPSGWLGDRFGTRGTLTRVVIAWSLFTFLSGAAWGFGSLLAFRFLFGAGEAGAYPNMAKVQREWLPARSRGQAGGLLWLLARWGGAFSPFIFGSILRGFKSPGFRSAVGNVSWLRGLVNVPVWRLGFFVSGAIGVIWAIWFFWFFRDRPSTKYSVNEAELNLIREGRAPTQQLREAGEQPREAGNEPHVWRQLFASPSLWAMSLLYLCGSFGWNFFVSWMPKFLEEVHGVKFEKSELISAAPLFFGGIACLTGGWISDLIVRHTGSRRWGRAILPIVGCTTAAVSIFCVRFAHSPREAIVLMCVTATAFDLGQAANWAAIIDIGGRYAGTSTGFINMVGNLGNSLQGILGALIFTRLGWPPLFAIFAGAYLVAGTMWLIIDPRHTFYRDEGPRDPSAMGFSVVGTSDSKTPAAEL